MEKIIIPTLLHQLRNQDGDLPIGIFFLKLEYYSKIGVMMKRYGEFSTTSCGAGLPAFLVGKISNLWQVGGSAALENQTVRQCKYLRIVDDRRWRKNPPLAEFSWLKTADKPSFPFFIGLASLLLRKSAATNEGTPEQLRLSLKTVQ